MLQVHLVANVDAYILARDTELRDLVVLLPEGVDDVEDASGEEIFTVGMHNPSNGQVLVIATNRDRIDRWIGPDTKVVLLKNLWIR